MRDKKPLTLRLPDTVGQVIAAVSGGADSMTMLHLLYTARQRGRIGTLLCAHYNHGLRPLAGRDENHVRTVCKDWGIPFVSGCGCTPRPGQSVEMAAREARYAYLQALLEDKGYDAILTAHTADDNAETVLLNLIRGTGLAGLCGIPYRRTGLVRPLLHHSRAEILAYAARKDIPYVEDETNADPIYRRNAIRRDILPLLKQLNPSFLTAVTRMTEHIRMDEALLEDTAQRALAEEGHQTQDSIAFPARVLFDLDRPVAFRILRAMLDKLSVTGAGTTHYEALLALCRAGQRGNRSDLPGPYLAHRSADHLVIERHNTKEATEPWTKT